MEAIEGHLENAPTTFFLPWPDDLIPSSGDKIWLPNMMNTDEFVVVGVEYRYTRKMGFEVHVTMEATKESEHLFEEVALTYASEEGFLLEDRVPISKVLKTAGFPTTAKGFLRKNKTA